MSCAVVAVVLQLAAVVLICILPIVIVMVQLTDRPEWFVIRLAGAD